MKPLKPNGNINVACSEIDIHQYVHEMSLSSSEAMILNPSQVPVDTFDMLSKGPQNFLILFESKHYDNHFLYLPKQGAGETFGCTDNPERDQVTINLDNESLSKRHATITFKDSIYTITDHQSDDGTWKHILSYYGEPICNAVYRIADCVFTCYKGTDIEFVDEWLQKHELLYLWDMLRQEKVNDLAKLRLFVINGFSNLDIVEEADKKELMKALENFERDYYEGCTKYRIVIQLIEGPMKGIEVEVGLRGITFGDSEAEINVFNDKDVNLTSHAKIIYQNGHYFLMNSYKTPELSFYKCNHSLHIDLESSTQHNIIPGDKFMLGSVILNVLRFSKGIALSSEGETDIFYDASENIPVLPDLNQYISCYILIDGNGSKELSKFVQKKFLMITFRELKRERRRNPDAKNVHNFICSSMAKVHETVERKLMKAHKEKLDRISICCVLILGDIIYCCNIGNTCAILSRSGKIINLCPSKSTSKFIVYFINYIDNL